MPTKTIYAVNRGSYSDYSVRALFSTKEKAEAYMEEFPDGEYNALEEYTLDPDSVSLKAKGYQLWHVLMLRDGSVERVNAQDWYFVHEAPRHWIWRRTHAAAYAAKGIPDALNSTVLARDEKHAVKIANEKRVQMIADGEWND
jgi:hypothetical protein